MRWAKAHDDARITAMAFDLNFRRLITGCENGGAKVISATCFTDSAATGLELWQDNLLINIVKQLQCTSNQYISRDETSVCAVQLTGFLKCMTCERL